MKGARFSALDTETVPERNRFSLAAGTPDGRSPRHMIAMIVFLSISFEYCSQDYRPSVSLEGDLYLPCGRKRVLHFKIRMRRYRISAGLLPVYLNPDLYLLVGIVLEEGLHDRGVFRDSRKEIDIATVPEAYILQMVKNRCINYLRDKANRLRIQQKMHEDSYKAIMAEIGVLGKDELGLIFRSDIATIFKNLLDSIPESTRDIFLASRFENLTYNEIAEKYGVSPRKVKREIQHVLEIMRISLKDYLPLLLIVYSLLNE